MHITGTSGRILRTAAVLFLAVVAGGALSRVQADEKKDEKKAEKRTGHEASHQRSTAQPAPARTQAPDRPMRSEPRREQPQPAPRLEQPVQRRPAQEVQRPGQVGTQRPDRGVRDTQRPGQLGTQQPDRGVRETQRPGQFGTQQPDRGARDTQRPGQFGTQRPDRGVRETQRPGQFGTQQPDRGARDTHPGQLGTRPPDRGPVDTYKPGREEVRGRTPGYDRSVYHPGRTVQTTRRPDGSQVHIDARTRTTVHTDPRGRITVVERQGLRATNFRRDGRPAHIERARVDGSRLVIDRGFHRERHFEVIRAGGVRVVSHGHRAFVERPFRAGYVSRTYVTGRRTEVRVYRAHVYHRMHYVTYVPAVYYRPAFYGWAIRPWGPRVYYSWGWEPAAPWFYGGYFAPAPYYPSPALWLTDYLLAANLRAAYESRQQSYEDQEPPPGMVEGSGVTLTPEVKAQIAEEVRRQLAAEQATAARPAAAAAGDEVPPALQQRVFVVSSSLEVTSLSGGQSCVLSPGDIIERTPGQPIGADDMVAVNVMSSKEGDCPAEFATALDLTTLQEMQNQFREQIASGMASLASNQGRGGLPAGPSAGAAPAAEGQAPPDAEAQDLVTNLNQEADQTEADAQAAATGPD